MIKIKKQPSFSIKDTRPLDRLVLKKMIKQITLWKDYVDYASKKDMDDSDSLDKYTLQVIYGELDDIASMDTEKGISQPSYLSTIEPQVKQALANLQIHNQDSVDNTITVLHNLMPK